MSLLQFPRSLYRTVSWQFGLNPRRFVRAFLGLPRLFRDWNLFRKRYSGTLTLMPCLHDWHEEGGTTQSEYFWQDLLVARQIFAVSPERHVDVGSRVDGFVAHVASFREIEVFDVRAITATVPGVTFTQADLMQPLADHPWNGYCDSLSCLHAIEHFGLGRYGDKIDPNGHERGITNMARLLRTGGNLYLSTPIGQERVEFNAHRVFDPRSILAYAASNNLRLRELVVINLGGMVRRVQPDEASLLDLARRRYSLGLFMFVKSR